MNEFYPWWRGVSFTRTFDDVDVSFCGFESKQQATFTRLENVRIYFLELTRRVYVCVLTNNWEDATEQQTLCIVPCSRSNTETLEIDCVNTCNLNNTRTSIYEAE